LNLFEFFLFESKSLEENSKKILCIPITILSQTIFEAQTILLGKILHWPNSF
jgi:hypothetical protein